MIFFPVIPLKALFQEFFISMLFMVHMFWFSEAWLCLKATALESAETE